MVRWRRAAGGVPWRAATPAGFGFLLGGKEEWRGEILYST